MVNTWNVPINQNEIDDIPLEYPVGDNLSPGQIAEEPQEEQYVDEESMINDRSVDKLNAFMEMTNIAENLDKEELNTIGTLVIDEYDIDKKSRNQWETELEDWFKLVKLIREHKNHPWEDAANIKYPLIAQSAIQFGSRAYQALLPDTNVVKGKVIGADPTGKKAERAKRVSEHMSYQFIEEMDYWEDEFDQLLIYLSIVGLAYRKTYRNKKDNRNESVFCTAEDVVVNYWAPNIERASRITQVFELYPYEIDYNIRSNAYLDFDYGNPDNDDKHDTSDKDAPHKFLEQHRWLDLDEDGYREPYIVTVHYKTKNVVRITPRYDCDSIDYDSETGQIISINPVQYFTDFKFIPSFDNSYYPLGFGSLLGPINEVINTSINQLLDAGTDKNSGGGFIDSRLKLGSGEIRTRPGEYHIVNSGMDDIRKGIMPRPVNEPSQVTYMLLDLLIGTGEKLASVTQIMMGQQPAANVPATTSLATIEQSLKVFIAIYKRIYRSLKSEFKKVYRLNRLYLTDQEYSTITDERKSIAAEDYQGNDCDIIPASNPNDVTDTMRLLSAQALLELRGQGLNDKEITKRYLEAMHIPDIDKLSQQPEEEQNRIDPAMQLELEKLNIEKEKLELENKKLDIEQERTKAEILKFKADAIRALADAESKEEGINIDKYKTIAESINRESEINAATKARAPNENQ